MFRYAYLTRPEDFVVFKLDIDTPLVEIALVKQLMADSTLQELVDEFTLSTVYLEAPCSGKVGVTCGTVRLNSAHYQRVMSCSRF
jgi:hypothetical protein